MDKINNIYYDVCDKQYVKLITRTSTGYRVLIANSLAQIKGSFVSFFRSDYRIHKLIKAGRWELYND